MGYRTLGLDLGIASIGWAYISDENGNIDLLGWGSRIFEPGMEEDISSGKGVSRCAERRAKRALRIQYARRREHKDAVIKLLTENKLLPENLTPGFFVETDKKLLDTYSAADRTRIGHVIPYLYRKKALDEELEAFVLGRTLFHLAQRRGYLSNRKQELKSEEESGKVKSGIRDLKEEMSKAGARTLGEFFSGLDPEKARIRGRYTDRSMYEEEFHLICRKQRRLIPEALEAELHKAIFFQRKLRSSKGLLGHCSKYPEEFRCSFAEEEAQLFRIYTTVNHLRIESKGMVRSPNEDERQKLITILNGFSDLFTTKGTVTLAKLGKALPLNKGEKFTLSDEEKEIYGNVLHAALFRVFGERAKEMAQEERKKFFHELDTIERDDILLKRLKGYWGLSEMQAETAMKVMLPDTYCSYSLKAIRELLPGLECGIDLSTQLKLDRKTERPLDKLPRFDSPECNIELRNPVVHRVMTELHRVVNAIIDRYGKPDAIRIELSRDLKSTNKERERITHQQREREKMRADVAARIVQEAGISSPSRNDILKVMLADECDFTCPYTGKHFSMTELLHGKNVHIEHIIPFSRSFDDSYRNKTLCEASANLDKSNRTPFEAYQGERYEEILKRVAHFKGPFAEYKLDLFKKDKIEDEDFISRNLNDTRYASKLAMRYLAKLYGGIADAAGRLRIFAVSGGHTALVRRAWGGNYLLGEGEKVRTDHRHHAIDALTIALTEPSLIQKIARMTPEERRYLHDNMTPMLGSRLFQQAKEKIESATVSHHVVNKLRGALHKETIYTKDYGKGVRHCRVPLSGLTAKEFPDIIDPKIKALILQKIGKISEKGLTDKDFAIFKDSGNLPHLLDRKGNQVNTIHYARITRNVATRTIGSGDSQREVANGANYLLAIFAQLDADGKERGWTGEIVTLLDACLKHQKHQPLFEKERSGLRFKFTLQKGDIVTWEKEGKEILCIVRGISLPQFYLVPIKDARMQKDLKAAKCWFTPTLSSAFQGHLTKYNMNLFGELQRAND